VRRSTLDKLLLDKAREAGAEVREGWRVLDLVNDGGLRVRGVSGSHGDGKRFSERATVVVGADGLNSIVASRARLTQRARWPRRVALVAHYENISGLTDWGEMHVDRGGYLGVARVGGDVANVALVIQARGARRIGGDLSGFLDAWIARRPHLAERFLSARRLAAVRATGPFARSTSRPWSDGLALAGDAAGFFDPFTGEGIYTALRGGEMLAEHLLRMYAGSNGNTALSDYESARRREFASRQLVEKIVGLAVGWPSFINRAAQQLSRRKEMADLLVGVTGDFVPAREVLTPRYLLGLLI
jgi:flavin-dependent dehydrogenase